LNRVTWFACLIAVAVTGLNLLVPELSVNEVTLSIARNVLLRSREEDINFLAQQKSIGKVKLRQWLQNVQLANLQRYQFYSSLEKDLFQQYILSLRIDSQTSEWNSRKELWEYFQPRIRKQHNPLTGAETVLEYLLMRVGIDSSCGENQDVDTLWIQKMASEGGFQRIYVAALRSIGIAARLDGSHQAEIWTGQAWAPAPRSPVTSFAAGRSDRIR
jgi:hypothetical protein